jgi:isopenicillin-N epimerase
MAAYQRAQIQISQSIDDYTPPPDQPFDQEWLDYMANNDPPEFGIATRSLLFAGLDPTLTFLAHGSYGAAMKPVLDSRHGWSNMIESNPVSFYYKILFDNLVHSIRQIASTVGSPPQNIVIVPNAEYGIQSVLRSVPVSPGDVWACLDITYEAVKHSLTHISSQRGVKLSIIPVSTPITPASIIRDLETHLLANPAIKLTLFEHITSPTAIVLPIAEMITVCKRHGVLSLIDGAHGIGQLLLTLSLLSPDFYVSNCHKWLCSCRGAAMLCTRL